MLETNLVRRAIRKKTALSVAVGLSLLCFLVLRANLDPSRGMLVESDLRISPVELQVIQVAKGALVKPGEPLDARYLIRTNPRGGWDITVWHVMGYDWLGHPEFVPGGHTDVELDKMLRVVSIHGGA